jgi:N-acetylmuramoyl-L-alanine amidase
MKMPCSFIRVAGGILLFCLLFAGVTSFMRGALPLARPVLGGGEEGPVFVLDAGHGGEDAGALGVDGTREKDLNLAVTQLLGEMLTAAGQRVVYTRTEDRLLYTEAQNIRGQRKMYDLRNRLALAEETPGAILVSIHMNKFPAPQYSGLQVYYGTGDANSRLLAETIQNGVRADLQPRNKRACRAAGEAIYLLHRATMPAVLIECGFLSNPAECQKLSDKDYQRQLSFSIFCAMIEYIEQ